MEIKFGIFFFGILNGVVAKNIFENQDKQSTEASNNNKECSTENQQTPHDTKCYLYYRCVYSTKILKECPDGMMFNQRIANCDSSYNVVCGSLETEEDDDSKYYGDFSDYYNIDDVTDSDNFESYEITTRKYTECPEKQDPYEPDPLLPHEERCNAFYKCVEGKKYEMKCPGILQFNARVLACDWPRNVKCVDRRFSSSSSSSSTDATTTTIDNTKEPTIEVSSQKTEYLKESSNEILPETELKTDGLKKPIYTDESSQQFALEFIKYFNGI